MNRIQVTSTYLTSVLYVQTRIQHWSLTAGNLGLSNSTGSGPAMFLGERAEKKVLYEGKATAASTSNSERRNVVITTLGGLLRELPIAAWLCALWSLSVLLALEWSPPCFTMTLVSLWG